MKKPGRKSTRYSIYGKKVYNLSCDYVIHKDLIGEATEYDKKLALEEKKPKSWCKSVNAFANTFGGALIFGISDNEQVVGLDDPEGDAEKIDVPQNKLNIQILDLIRKDSKISTEKIAIASGVSSKTIKRHVKEMHNVSYIGHGFSGRWEIIDNE